MLWVWYSLRMEDQFQIQTMSVSLCVLVVSLLILVVGFLGKWRSVAKSNASPVVGTMLNLAINIRRLHDYHAEIAERLKNFRFMYLTCSYVFTADPINVEHILKTNIGNYIKGKKNQEKMRELLGEGILAVDGEKWMHHRKLASVEFSSKMLRDFSRAVFHENTVKVACILKEAAERKEILEMQDLFMKAVFDGNCKVLFGLETDSLCAGTGTGSVSEASFFKAFEDASAMMFQRYMSSLWKVKKLLNVGSEAIMRKSIRTVDGFLYSVIQSRRKELNSLEKENVKPDILSRYMSVVGSDSENPSDKFLRDVILNFMVASRDTVAITLSWFLYMLCKHQDIQDKLFMEISRATEETENADKDYWMFIQNVTDDALERLHYLQATLSETLRLYPAIPVDGRYVVEDDALADGSKVKKGDFVNYMPYAMGRMTYLWGPDAKEFKPERWLDENGTFRHQSPFKFTAFQGGPRMCIGKDLAFMQMKIMAIVLISFFKFECINQREITYKTMLTLHMSEGLRVQVTTR